MRKLLLLVALLSTGAMAQSTLYIGDKVKIPMRSDASITKSNIITKLGINTPVTLIKKQTNGWSQVKHQGKQGWIISRYLTNIKPNGDFKKQAKQITKLTKSNQVQQQTIVELKQDLNQQHQSVATLKAESTNYGAQVLELSKLRNKTNNLDQTNTDLMAQVRLLKSQASALHSTDFLTIISTLTLLLGLALGFLTFRMSANKANRIYSI